MMDNDVGLLSHHGKKPYKTSQSVSDTEPHHAHHQRLYVALARLVAAGFSVDTDGQRLKVSPATLLTPAQRDWIRDNKAALVAVVSTPAWRWCIEYPDGQRLVADYLPATDWRTVASDYPGATAWPVPDGLDVAEWIDGGTP